MKIIIADDSAFMRTIIKSALLEADPGISEILEAENGDVTLELYREYKPDIVFLDIIMPVKNGIMTLEELREDDPNLKIVIVTSVGQEDMINKAKELNANGFISKPFQPTQIQEIYNQLKVI